MKHLKGIIFAILSIFMVFLVHRSTAIEFFGDKIRYLKTNELFADLASSMGMTVIPSTPWTHYLVQVPNWSYAMFIVLAVVFGALALREFFMGRT